MEQIKKSKDIINYTPQKKQESIVAEVDIPIEVQKKVDQKI